MRKTIFLTSLFLLTYSQLSQAGDIISPPYKGAKLGNFQCLIRNDSQREIYVISEWIECTNKGTVSSYRGKELVPGENFNLVTTDKRACRCRVTFDGNLSDISIILFSGTMGSPYAHTR